MKSTARLGRRHQTVVHMLEEAVTRTPERPALSMDGRTLTYAEYGRAVAAFAERLLDAGASGERVALVLPNGLDACIATFGTHAARAQLVPLNPQYTTRELREILEDAAPTVLVHAPDRAGDLASLGRELGIGHIWQVGPDADDLAGEAQTGAAPRALPAPFPEPADLSLLQYTGGTTGRAKGVNLTHGAAAVNVAQRESLLPTSSDGERILCVMPLFHSYALSMGLYLAANCAGALVIRPRFHPEDLLETVEREAITIFPGSPTIFAGLMAHERFASTDWSSVHTCYSGSAPLSEHILDRWEAAVGAPIYEGYGQTEAGPILTFNPAHGPRKPGSVGVPVADTEVEIVQPGTDSGRLPAGQSGEIRARGPQIMSGYRNLAGETGQALRDGWLYTGDVGDFDADGYLYIRDRLKDMVIVGGYNVYPREIEDILHAHPEVAEAGAVGVPDDYRGEVVHAYVVPRPNSDVTADALISYCRQNLARYKIPASVDLIADLPKTAVGKIDRKALRATATSAGQIR